jgi:hypothetical protein
MLRAEGVSNKCDILGWGKDIYSHCMLEGCRSACLFNEAQATAGPLLPQCHCTLCTQCITR